MPTIEQKRLARFDTGTLAGVYEKAFLHDRMTPGVLFARGQRDEEIARVRGIETGRTGKAEARSAISMFIARHNFPGPIKILTMPGYHWTFEKLVLKWRESHWQTRGYVKRTKIVAVECDEGIYRASFAQIPGLAFGMEILPARPERELHVVRTPVVTAYHCAYVEDFAMTTREQFQLAWLDFTGPITAARVHSIDRLWRVAIRPSGWLVVTSLKARWTDDALHAVRQHGSVGAWLCAIVGKRADHGMMYRDGSPMIQLGWRKR